MVPGGPRPDLKWVKYLAQSTADVNVFDLRLVLARRKLKSLNESYVLHNTIPHTNFVCNKKKSSSDSLNNIPVIL